MRRYLIVMALFLSVPTWGWGLETKSEIGLRGGTDTGIVNEVYAYAELYYLRPFSWRKSLNPTTSVYTRLDAGAGYLGADSRDGGFIAVGGDLVFSLMDGRWEFDLGIRPGLLSRHTYGDDDFGGPFQFFNHAGLTYRTDRLSIGYTLQHISNAGLYGRNEGLNLHLIGVGLRF